MADITVTASKVRLPNETEVIKIRGRLGAAASPGQFVYLDGSNGWKPADADGQASAMARGLVLSDNFGSTSFESGQMVDIVVLGRVTGFSGMTPGANVFVSTTPGAIDHTAPAAAGDYPFAAGWAESAETVFVSPQIAVPAANGA